MRPTTLTQCRTPSCVIGGSDFFIVACNGKHYILVYRVLILPSLLWIFHFFSTASSGTVMS